MSCVPKTQDANCIVAKWFNRLINLLINRFVSIVDCNMINFVFKPRWLLFFLFLNHDQFCFFVFKPWSFFYHDQSNNSMIDRATITSSIQVLWQPICQSGDGQNIIYREQTALCLVVTIVVAVNSRKGKHFCSAQNKQDMNHTQKANFEQETQIRWMEDFLKHKNIGVPHFWDS